MKLIGKIILVCMLIVGIVLVVNYWNNIVDFFSGQIEKIQKPTQPEDEIIGNIDEAVQEYLDIN